MVPSRHRASSSSTITLLNILAANRLFINSKVAKICKRFIYNVGLLIIFDLLIFNNNSNRYKEVKEIINFIDIINDNYISTVILDENNLYFIAIHANRLLIDLFIYNTIIW